MRIALPCFVRMDPVAGTPKGTGKDREKRSGGKSKFTWEDALSMLEDDTVEFQHLHSKLSELIAREGVPTSVRGKVWQRLGGTAAKRASNMSYVQLLNTFQGHTSPHTVQIEKDLRRTFPDNEVFETDEGISTLRRVLVAYSWLNPEIGYCQSMNFIAALFLLFMDEEEAFWLLRVVVENILPADYYTSSMLGVRADAQLLEEIISQRVPKVAQHLARLDVNLGGFTIAWFMSIFVNILPLECTLRVFDLLFCYGSHILFRFGLTIFKVNERVILKEKSFEKLYLLLRSLPSNFEDSVKFVEAALHPNLMGPYKCDRIAQRRAELWTQLHTTFIAEDDRRGQTLHFDVEGQKVRRKDSDDPPDEQPELEPKNARGPSPVTWSPSTPVATRNVPDEILGAPRSQLLRSKTDNHFDGAPPSPIPKRLSVEEKSPPPPPPRRKRDSLTRQQSAQDLSRDSSPFASMVSYSRKSLVNKDPPTSPLIASKSSPPPVPARTGPTRAKATRQMVDSRYEERFRPLSIFVSGDSPLLPTMEVATLSARSAVNPEDVEDQDESTAPAKRRSPPPLPANRIKPSTLPRRGTGRKPTAHQNGTFPRRGLASPPPDTVPRRSISTSVVQEGSPIASLSHNAADVKPPLESPVGTTVTASPPMEDRQDRQDSQRDLKALLPHNTYDHVVIDDESPVPSPRKTKHAAVRISKLELEGGLNQLIDVSSSGWSDDEAEHPPDRSATPPRREPPAIPKPPPRRG